MDIKYEYYPHPVLWDYTGDYRNSSFECDIEQERGVRQFTIRATFRLENWELLRMVQNNEAEFLLHIESPASSYRLAQGSKSPDMTVHLKDEHLLGKVSLCPFLVAKKDLDHFPNQDWVEDYHGVTFQIEKGTILAIVRSRHLPWKKKKRISARFRLYLRFIRKRHRKSAPITLTSSVDPYYNAKRSHRVTPPVQSENIHLIHNI